MLKILKFNLFLHDEGGATASEGAESGGNTEQSITPEVAADAEPQEEVSSEDLSREFDELTRGKFKDQFKQATQKIIDRRFAKAKEAETLIKEQGGILNILHQRYGTRSNAALLEALENDDEYLEKRAYELGMTKEQAANYDRMQRQLEQYKGAEEEAKLKAAKDAQINKWITEANAFQEKFPGFDFRAELENDEFSTLLQAGVPVEHAYKILHYDELMQMNTAYASQQTEKKVVENIRARGTRPQEVGGSNKAAFTSSQSIENLTGEQIREILRTKSTGDKLF